MLILTTFLCTKQADFLSNLSSQLDENIRIDIQHGGGNNGGQEFSFGCEIDKAVST